jgi:hypothetical protein
LCASGNKFNVADPELRLEFLARLRKDEIEFVDDSSGDICYAPELQSQIVATFIEVHRGKNPLNHVWIEGGIFAERMFPRLNEAGIDFTHFARDGGVVLVLKDLSDAARVDEIAYEVARTFAKKKIE